MHVQKKKILIVDDQPDFTAIIKYQLESEGPYVVCEENRATETVKTAHEFKPDLILLDVLMPDRDGSLVAAELLEDKELKSIPVVFFTAIVAPHEAPDGFVGGYPFLSKKSDLQDLKTCVEKYT